ncbi:MAG: aminopeptidase N C-terminal domain-containing protein, partial [Methylocella sp.]
AARLLLRSVERIRAGDVPDRDKEFVAAIAAVIERSTDPAFTGLAITLPGEADIAREIGEDVDPDAIHIAREALRKDIGQGLKDILLATYARLAPDGPYSPDAIAAGRRALRNAALNLFAAGDKIEGALLARGQFERATTMTDEIAALGVLAHIPGNEREDALDAFYRAHEGEALVIDKWFALQATIPESGTLNRVKTLLKHKAFSFNNPNRIRSLAGSFAAVNPTQFNAEDGSGYDFIAGIVLDLDAKNPQVAARLLSAFKSWRTLETKRRGRAKATLRHVVGAAKLSPDVKDIAERSLA